jgi:tryptophan halogenase
MTGAAFASALTEESAARELLGTEASMRSAELVSIRPGRRPAGWVRNVVAFGDAAVALDPLEWTNLHLAHSAIIRALSLLPGRDFHPLVLEEYNRRTGYETARARDFVSLHYLGSRRADGEFWEAMRARSKHGSLAHVLEQFGERGRLPHHEEDSFSDESWVAVLIGLGIRPRRIAAIAAAVNPEEGAATLERLSDMTLPLPSRLPSYADYLTEIRTLVR